MIGRVDAGHRRSKTHQQTNAVDEATMYAPVSWVIYANLLKASGDYFERISSVSFGGVLSAALPMAILTHGGMLVASFLF